MSQSSDEVLFNQEILSKDQFKISDEIKSVDEKLFNDEPEISDEKPFNSEKFSSDEILFNDEILFSVETLTEILGVTEEDLEMILTQLVTSDAYWVSSIQDFSSVPEHSGLIRTRSHLADLYLNHKYQHTWRCHCRYGECYLRYIIASCTLII